MAEPDPDLDLILALQGGDESALTELMTRYQEPIFGFIYRHIFNEADARELTQEVFVRVYFNAAKFHPKAHFSAWLYRIALNLCRDFATSRRARQAARTDSLTPDDEDRPPRDIAAAGATPADELVTGEKLAAVERGIAALPPDLRTPLVLSALEERSHQECAELLNISPKAVEMRIYRARKQLAAWLTKAGF